jgi:hypothetical protein
VLFVGQMLVSDDGALRYARENAEVIWQVPIAAALLSIYYAAFGVAVASLTSRRIIAGAVIIGIFLVSSIVSNTIVESESFRETEQGTITGPTTVVTTEEGDVITIPESGFPEGEVVPVDRGTHAAGLLDLLELPLVLRDLVFLGHIDEVDPLSGLANGGLYAIAIFAVIVLGSLVVLFIRYDEVER